MNEVDIKYYNDNTCGIQVLKYLLKEEITIESLELDFNVKYDGTGMTQE